MHVEAGHGHVQIGENVDELEYGAYDVDEVVEHAEVGVLVGRHRETNSEVDDEPNDCYVVDEDRPGVKEKVGLNKRVVRSEGGICVGTEVCNPSITKGILLM